METFYVVMRADVPQTTVSIRHETESAAREEAERLVQKTGKPFVVLQAIASVQIAQFPVKWLNVGEDD
ncbi:hypothetical protein ANRL1_03165 [Anaerolineae bacterium]|nr:hypothetical protein ANRL1_03165 [Anaerolineae bacterium]